MKRTRLKSYLKAIIAKYGMDVLLNGQKAVNLIAVTYKNSMDERHLLKLIYEHGVMDELIGALKGADVLEAVDNSVKKLKMSALMPEDEAERLIRDIADAIKLQIPRRPKASKKSRANDNPDAAGGINKSIEKLKASMPKVSKDDVEKLKGQLSGFKSKYLDKVSDGVKSLKIEENAKQMLADSKLGQKAAAYFLRDDYRIGERGRKLVNGIAITAAWIFGLAYLGLYMHLTQYIELTLDPYYHPFVDSLLEYILCFIVFFFVDLRCELKDDTDFTKDKLFGIFFWAMVSLPVLASLGNGVNLFACALRSVPAFITGFLGLVIGKIAGEDLIKRTNWSKTYLITASVIGVVLVVLASVIFSLQ